MLFNSLIFIFFSVFFFLIWPFVRKWDTSRWFFIVAASFFFYGWCNWRYVFLLAASGCLNYAAGIAISGYKKRAKPILFIAIAANLIILGAFKYLLFLINNINFMLGGFGLGDRLPQTGFVLPIGISFFTFMEISYLVEIHNGKQEPTKSLLHFLAYISMFPHLVAGPIVRASHLLPQLMSYRKNTPEERWDGAKLVIIGLFKKVVLADNLSPLVNRAFNTAGTPEMPHSAAYWWVAATFFAFQILFDFSGYSDIARGLARWMGYDFPLNFNHPYNAASVRDFWSRWHISLSTWFRDYVYIPLGGNRKGAFRGYVNMWVTMLLSGLWHGASWTFVAWGGIHAFYLTLERLFKWPEALARFRFTGRAIVTVLLLAQVWVAWVFFRARTFSQAFEIVKTMFSFRSLKPGAVSAFGLKGMFFLLMSFVIELLLFEYLDRRGKQLPKIFFFLEPLLYSAMIAACVYFRGTGNAFIYFKF
jgi:alginate O-acetyltransferase complex protein AlgI